MAHDPKHPVLPEDMMLKLWQCTNEITGAEWPKAYQAKSPCPTLKANLVAAGAELQFVCRFWNDIRP